MTTTTMRPGDYEAMLLARLTELRAAARPRRRASTRAARPRRALAVVFMTSILMVFGAVMALAVHNTGVFELDGNTADGGGAGVDWDNVFAGTAGALDTSFQHDEAEPDPTHHEPSNKDEAGINAGTSGDWGCVTKMNVNNKDDIRHAYAAAYEISGDLHVFFGADRDTSNGDANIGFWFFQTPVSCTSPGDFSGHKVDGDLFVVSEFVNGGSISEILIFQWTDPDGIVENGDECLGDGVDCTASHSGDDHPLASGIDCQAADPHIGSPFVCATVNGATIPVPWEDAANDPDEAEFFEGGINIEELIPDAPCFTGLLAETRSSQSLDANLFDYAFLDLSTCGQITAHKYLDVNGNGQDDGEPALEGWTIDLYASDGTTLLDSDTTDSGGDVVFGTLDPDTYVVCEQLLSATPAWVNSDPAGITLCETVVVDPGDSDTVDFGNGQPDIDVTKEPSATDICDGDTVTYTITVTNTGNVDLTVDVSDDVLGTLATDVLIAAGANAVYTPSQAITGTVTNTVTATGDWDGATPAASATATASVTSYDCTISLTKTPRQTDVCNGSTVFYDYVLTNNSPQFTWSGSLSDDVYGVLDAAIVLGPSGVANFVASGPITGTVTNIADAVGAFDDPANTSANAQATATVNGYDCTISLTKTVNDNEVCAGDSVTYSYVVHNNSTQFTWTGDITDDNGTPGNLLDDFTVASGVIVGPGLDSSTFTHNSVIGLGTVTNIATADGNFDDPASTSATDTDDETVTGINCGGGCTPGFWQGGLGITLWNQFNDPDWVSHGGVGFNPFVTTDLFTSFFPASGNSFVDNAQMITVVGSGGTNSWPRKAARDLIAAYLNASFGIGYPYSTATIDADWLTAVAGGTAGFQAFHAKYSVANELGCTIT